MFTDSHLTLQIVKLLGNEKWETRGAGLCFAFVRNGAGVLKSGADSHRLVAGDAVVLSKENGGRMDTGGNAEIVFSHFSLLIEHVFPLFSVSEIAQVQNVMGNFQKVKVINARNPLAAECHRLVAATPPLFELDHRAHLLRIVATILNGEFKSLPRGRPGFISREQRLIQVFEELSADDLLNLSSNELSLRFGCGVRHLGRLFHQHFGFSLAALRMELRMLRAISLLRDADAKVAQVADQCGFNHLGFFNRCFKRRFGMSPGRWRIVSAKASTLGVSPRPERETGNQSDTRAPGMETPSPPPVSSSTQLKKAALSPVLEVLEQPE